ncbi:hypothetical protein MOTE_19190 [Moorella thermoacetica]|uniref:Uncharacterized protein n=1 Tax=Neomoorella thermoacetica TaxID=1525 RepID=A0A1J5P3N3_NEOTH|nr:hypothetical protein MOTE_19190 [Moorella thermoacetica]
MKLKLIARTKHCYVRFENSFLKILDGLNKAFLLLGGIKVKVILRRCPIAIVFIILTMLVSSAAFAGYAVKEDQTTARISTSDGAAYYVTIDNAAREDWEQYDRFDNNIYHHLSDGFVVAGLSFPFDIYPDTTIYIKSNGVTTNSISSYELVPLDVLKPRWDYMYYGGEVYKNLYYPISGSTISASIFYGFQAFDDLGYLGAVQDYNNFNLW